MAEDRSLICISSSPELPSLAELLARQPKKPATRTGSNATPIPDDAPTNFTAATSMWRASRTEIEAVSAELRLAGSRPLATANPTVDIALDSSALLPPAGLPLEVPKKKPRATRATGTTRKKKAGAATTAETDEGLMPEGAAGAPPVAPKPPRKRRVTKTAEDGQTTLPKGRVTKPSATRKVHFSKEPSVPKDLPETRPCATEDGPSDLEPATRRRTDWTPPPDDAHIVNDSSAIKELASTTATLNEATGDLFKCLQETFGRKEGEQRKLLHMVTTATTSETTSKSTTPEVSPVKSKAPKKKPRTITDLAMAAYRVAEEPGAVGAMEAPKQDSIVGVGAKKATKKPAKPRAPRKKPEPKKPILLSPVSAMRQVSHQDFVFGTASQLAAEEDPELLHDPFQSSSPVTTELSLRRRGGNKLWVAGARDDEGDLVDIEVIDMTDSPAAPIPIPALRQETLPVLPKHKDKEATPPRGSQHVPIELSSDFPSFNDTPLPKSHFFMTQAAEPRVATEPTTPAASLRYAVPEPGSVTIDFDLDLEPPPSNQEHNTILSQSQSILSPKPKAATKAKAKVVAKRAAPKAKEQPQAQEQAVEEEATGVAEEQATMGPPPPKYELFTDAQLMKEIASYGFKVVKKRTAMIELLQQCWAQKHKTAVPAPNATATANPASVPASAAAPPTRPRGRPKKAVAATEAVDTVEPAQPAKKPRGRPRKDATAASPSKAATTKTTTSSRAAKPAATVAPKTMEPSVPATPKRRKAAAKGVVEILDSDDSDSDPFASSPLMSPERREDVFSSPARGDLELSITEDTEMSLMVGSPTMREMEVFDYITKAVKTEPPTRDVREPSWHEKMLMYDPVILEDLAAWLNSGQLDRVGYDGEVAASEVKSWCESKSICSKMHSPSERHYSAASTATTAATKKPPSPVRPSASILLLSPTNQVLLLHRVKSSSSFASAHVFPGGNLSAFHEGELPPLDSPDIHQDSEAYRLAAIRETFEESGILLARPKEGRAELLDVSSDVLDAGRKEVHANKVKFVDWLSGIGGVADIENLHPFTRWVTPPNMPKRFTTQMYLYMLPLSAPASASKRDIIHTPTHDGGLEHTAAAFDDARNWLARAKSGEVVLFPPQCYLLHLVSQFMTGPPVDGTPGEENYQKQRRALMEFIKRVPTAEGKHATAGIPWAEKAMSPTVLFVRKGDKRAVLGLDKPGPELKGSGRGGDWERVVLVSRQLTNIGHYPTSLIKHGNIIRVKSLSVLNLKATDTNHVDNGSQLLDAVIPCSDMPITKNSVSVYPNKAKRESNKTQEKITHTSAYPEQSPKGTNPPTPNNLPSTKSLTSLAPAPRSPPSRSSTHHSSTGGPTTHCSPSMPRPLRTPSSGDPAAMSARTTRYDLARRQA
ncbi:hypothetical protein QBC39DRAFT_427199 [Podospora conica]|nr:hypothetical protein QBC39DRAFT_427199 [Schizothecium conicum]